MKREIKAGDLVRVRGGTLKGGHGHRIKQGAVCEVVCTLNGLGFVDIKGPSRRITGDTLQGVDISHLKLAKQAMNKRGQYSERRG